MASAGIAAGRDPVHTAVDTRLTAYRVGLVLGSRLIAQSEDAVVRTTATGWHPRGRRLVRILVPIAGLIRPLDSAG